MATHETTTKDQLPALEPILMEQLERYIAASRLVNDRRGEAKRKDIEREATLLHYIYAQYLYSREVRIDDVESPEIQEAIAKKATIFPLGIPKLMICLDGRVLAKLFAGLHGNSLRLPAGDSKEIVPDEKTGKLFLPLNSNLAKMLFWSFTTQDTVVEVLDSHAGCAARGKEENERYNTTLADNGRYLDVLRKKAMGVAMTEAVTRKYGDKKRLVIIQTSFDPHTGYLVMGLEKSDCLADPRVQKDGYTDAIVAKLVGEGTVISAEALVTDQTDARILELFKAHEFKVNYEIDYRKSTKRFWDNIMAMQAELLPIIEKKLDTVFAKLDPLVRKERAAILLANAYNAYLHNLYPHYPYHEHDESIIIGTYSDKGPYDRVRSFATNPDDPNFTRNAALAYELIKGNRTASRMSETEKVVVEQLYPDAAEYALAPVPLVKFERFVHLPNDLKAVQETDWSDLVDINWSLMTDEEFGNYLESKVPNITLATAETINRLRHRASRLYKPRRATTNLLLEGRIAPMWIIAGPDRKSLVIMPFLKSGYNEAELTPANVLDDAI